MPRLLPAAPARQSPHTFLTVNQVAELLQLSPLTVRDWIRSGLLPHVKVGRRTYRIDRDDLERWLRTQKGGGA